MNEGKPHKSCNRDSALDDKFTNLPRDLTDLILSSLPIRDAIRTSVLSSKWQFKWTTMPNLVFDQHCSSFTPQDQKIIKKNIVDMIYRALILRTGPVSKFVLHQTDPITHIDIDRWILYLSTCLVQEFILEIWEGPRYKLHSFLFSFQHLVNLELYRCNFELPSNFRGFNKLKSLDLQNLTVSQHVFETLISSCPVLESLTSYEVTGFTHLNIVAPNLLDIVFEGYFDDINFVNTSNLETVSVEFIIAGATGRIKARDFSSLLKFFSSLPRIRRLKILGNFLEFLANGNMPLQLPNPCRDLGYLEVNISIDSYVECSAALCLLRSSPNIQELEITVKLCSKEMDLTFWQSKHNSCSLNKLEIVKISGISGNIYELEFIRFILLASPVLKRMSIKYCSEDQAVQLSRELVRFQPASTKAVISFYYD